MLICKINVCKSRRYLLNLSSVLFKNAIYENNLVAKIFSATNMEVKIYPIFASVVILLMLSGY